MSFLFILISDFILVFVYKQTEFRFIVYSGERYIF